MDMHRIIVFLPCHSLGDFPTWLDEGEADDLLSAWTAAWHPLLIAAAGSRPEWASADFTPPDIAGAIAIVPDSVEERFATHVDSAALDGARWVRRVSGRAAIVAAAATASGAAPSPAAEPLVADFHALGLAWLLADLLARRMRSEMDLESSGFDQTVVEAARAAVAGDIDAARGRLAECFGALEATRSHYYPVDVWLLDTVLLAPSTLGTALDRELDSPVSLGILATGEVVESWSTTNPAAMFRMRARLEAGSLSIVGGRHAARPLDLCTPTEIEADLERGRGVWERHCGHAPRVFGQIAGGMAPILPRLLTARGYAGCLWTLFDGTPLPDAGGSRILWEGSDGAAIDAVARPPLDARRARTFIALADQIGTCMDHDHTVVVQFAHYAGTACCWHDDFRRIASWSKVCGEFVTPDELFRRTAGAGLPVSFPADAYPVALPVDGIPLRDQVAAELSHAASEAACAAETDNAAASTTTAPTPAPPPRRHGWLSRITAAVLGRPSATSALILDNGLIRAKVHQGSGGLVSVRLPNDGGNRLSQRLALRTTRPAPAVGQPWEDVHERAIYSGMVADAVDRVGGTIESRGRLTGPGGDVGSFVQRVSLADGLPLVILEVEVQLTTPLSGPSLESYAACRFAWHENEMPDILRSLNLEPIITERWRFTAPHVIEIRPATSRAERPPTQILTLGLPWHVRSGEHMLDSVLPADAAAPVVVRLAVGAGLDRPGSLAIDLMARHV
jgi:alpha-mannosidase